MLTPERKAELLADLRSQNTSEFPLPIMIEDVRDTLAWLDELAGASREVVNFRGLPDTAALRALQNIARAALGPLMEEPAT